MAQQGDESKTVTIDLRHILSFVAFSFLFTMSIVPPLLLAYGGVLLIWKAVFV